MERRDLAGLGMGCQQREAQRAAFLDAISIKWRGLLRQGEVRPGQVGRGKARCGLAWQGLETAPSIFLRGCCGMGQHAEDKQKCLRV